MPYELKLAWRYLFSKRGGLVRFTSLVAVIGITVGVASLIIAQALAKGFSDEMRDKVLSNTSHITIFAEGKSRLSNWKIVKDKIEQIDNVKSVEPTSYENAVLSGERGSSYAVIRLLNKSDPNVHLNTDSGTGLTKISIGKELSEKLDLKKGNSAQIVTIGNDETAKNSDVLIDDIFETGLFEYDSTWIYVSRSNYLKLKKITNLSPTIFSVSLADIFLARETGKAIKTALGKDFRVLDWQEANKPLFAALRLERKVALAIISLIIFIAALNITTTLALLINERRSDIAILRTCGARKKNLIGIFLFEGTILSSIGIFSGLFLGISGCIIGNYFKIINISKEVYSLNYIPLSPNFWDIAQVILITFILCLAAVVYPTLRVSKIKPLENFRKQ